MGKSVLHDKNLLSSTATQGPLAYPCVRKKIIFNQSRSHFVERPIRVVVETQIRGVEASFQVGGPHGGSLEGPKIP